MENRIFFSEEDIAIHSSFFKFGLIGKFSHRRPSLPELKSALETIELKSAFIVSLMDPRHILLRFNHEEDYHRVWLREQWYLKRFSMKVFKSMPYFRLDIKLSIGPVWVNFPKLPMIFYEKQSLSPLQVHLDIR